MNAASPLTQPERGARRHVAFPDINRDEGLMGRGCLLWLIGVPLPIIILLYLLGYL